MSTIAKQKVLFVDDEMDWRTMACASLAGAGFDVLTASDGTEAMREAGHYPLGLIIVDEDLAGESGIMLTKFLRRNHPEVPTMLYTRAAPDADTALNLKKQGIDFCLPKGTMADLVANVGCYLR